MEIRVSSTSLIKLVAGSITKALKTEDVTVVAIGSSAITNAIKSIATARGYLVSEGRSDICIIPSYTQVESMNGFNTGISFEIKKIKL